VERKKTKVGASFGCRTGSWLVFLSGDVEIFGEEEVGMCERRESFSMRFGEWWLVVRWWSRAELSSWHRRHSSGQWLNSRQPQWASPVILFSIFGWRCSVLPGLHSDLSVPCIEVLLVSIHQQCLILPGCCAVHVSSCAFVARGCWWFHQFS
jgi:hypothetical protein